MRVAVLSLFAVHLAFRPRPRFIGSVIRLELRAEERLCIQTVVREELALEATALFQRRR